MAGLGRQLAEADAALATLDKAVATAAGSPIERDAAIFWLIYTFAAVAKACTHLFAEHEGIETGSVNAAIRMARRLGWLSDEDAEAAIAAGRDRELAFEMNRPRVGDEIAGRLTSHAAVLRRWLEALHERES